MPSITIVLTILVAVLVLLTLAIGFTLQCSRKRTQSKELDLKNYLMPAFHKHGFIQNDTNPDLMDYKDLYSINISSFPLVTLFADFGDGMEQAGEPIPIVEDGATPEESAQLLDEFIGGLVSMHQKEVE
ncbi:hypothetical protein [Photobacterium lutimaris]|uniref:Uncharacterized protein n=1 Tax=Photobacterium lutimaris TaxID=388278 RepID=A0A2T3J4J6_9GAMM|nr:hypothetical protein [Photobacterium lutimaris]PSU36212.1 hypothetical protein C9I99_04215 [Photobacterium lutimaris]TDR74916.1 hypothetical protein DFP78_106247 [Photobacterium lutimaris]